MHIQNVRVLENDLHFVRHDLLVDGAQVHSIEDFYCDNTDFDDLVVEAQGGYLLPGLIDLQAYAGEPEEGRLRAYARALLAEGTTRFLWENPYVDEAELGREAEVVRRFREQPDPEGAALEGIRLVGPFLNPETAPEGVACLPADKDMAKRLTESGAIRMLEVSPEVQGIGRVIRAVKEKCLVNVIPEDTRFDPGKMACVQGAQLTGQLEEQLRAFSVEDPGMLAAAVESPCMAELAVCSPELHPATVRMAFHLFGADRICLVTGGMPGVTMAECVRRAAGYGVPLPIAGMAATLNPARLLGIPAEKVRVCPGSMADFVLFDLHDLTLRLIVREGRCIYNRDEPAALGG
ncbi:MAG: amidohydrolase family protein [Lachnospiraceae bacterium]|nr:amidohydrolase family protein [Lachnospiraceae bacterium]